MHFVEPFLLYQYRKNVWYFALRSVRAITSALALRFSFISPSHSLVRAVLAHFLSACFELLYIPLYIQLARSLESQTAKELLHILQSGNNYKTEPERPNELSQSPTAIYIYEIGFV